MNDPINFNGTWVMKSSENQDEVGMKNFLRKFSKSCRQRGAKYPRLLMFDNDLKLRL